MDNSNQILINLVFTYKTINSSYSPSITFIILSSNHLTNITTLHVLTSPLCSTLIHLCSFSKSRPYLCSLSTDIPLMLPLTISAQNVSQGDYVQLTCVVSKGDHPIFFSWYLNGVRIDENTQSAAAVNVGRQTSLLMLHSVTFTNAGNYTCDAANPAGRTAQTASLSVTGTGLALALYKSSV
uniref:Ig-like domain-containing protein n=2 Tax=Cacopsylla melanoneura TaxID=428564 RepID=A0A8D9BN82_9HEMI